jgi:hypothetical protein
MDTTNLEGLMYAVQVRLIVGWATFLSMTAAPSVVFAQDMGAREKAAREAAVAYAKACNLKTNRAAAAMKVAAVPFFPGGFYFPLSGPGSGKLQAWLYKEDRELQKYFDARPFDPELSLKVLRVEKYADFRKKYLEKDPPPADPGDPSSENQRNFQLQQLEAARWALDQAVGKDGLIVFLGDEKEISQKKNISQGILVRFEKGTAKVSGVLDVLNPDWILSPFNSKNAPKKK